MKLIEGISIKQKLKNIDGKKSKVLLCVKGIVLDIFLFLFGLVSIVRNYRVNNISGGAIPQSQIWELLSLIDKLREYLHFISARKELSILND